MDFQPLLSQHLFATVFVVTFMARVGAPIPAAPLLMLVAGWAQVTPYQLGGVAAASIAGNLAGDGVWFLAGKRLGLPILGLLCRVSLSPDICVSRSEGLIAKWGGLALVGAKFLPGLSVVAAPVAGAVGMPWQRFVAYGLLSGAAWTLAFMWIGWLLREEVARTIDLLAQGGTYSALACVLALLAFVGYRYWQRAARRRELAVPRICAETLERLMMQGDAPLIVDVRPESLRDADRRRLPGALVVPLGEISQFAREIDPDTHVVTYCSCPFETSSARACIDLSEAGVHHAHPLEGGIEAWFSRGRGGAGFARHGTREYQGT